MVPPQHDPVATQAGGRATVKWPKIGKMEPDLHPITKTQKKDGAE